MSYMQELRRNLNRKPCDQPDVGNAQGLWRKEGGVGTVIFSRYSLLWGWLSEKLPIFWGVEIFVDNF